MTPHSGGDLGTAPPAAVAACLRRHVASLLELRLPLTPSAEPAPTAIKAGREVRRVATDAPSPPPTYAAYKVTPAPLLCFPNSQAPPPAASLTS